MKPGHQETSALPVPGTFFQKIINFEKRYLVLVLMLVCLAVTVHAFEDQFTTDFREAGQLYQDGRYQEAVNIYEQMLKAGKESGPIYYNLGNSYFKLGEKGRAILNYERAKRLIPRDSDLRFNEQYVRSLTTVQFDSLKETFIERAINGHISFYTTEEMVLIILVCISLIAVTFLLFLYLKWPPSVFRSVFIVFIFLTVVYTAGLVLKMRVEHNAAIVLKRTSASFEPLSDSTAHFSLPQGAKVIVVKESDKWAKIKRFDGKLGWVPSADVEEIEEK